MNVLLFCHRFFSLIVISQQLEQELDRSTVRSSPNMSPCTLYILTYSPDLFLWHLLTLSLSIQAPLLPHFLSSLHLSTYSILSFPLQVFPFLCFLPLPCLACYLDINLRLLSSLSFNTFTIYHFNVNFKASTHLQLIGAN